MTDSTLCFNFCTKVADIQMIEVMIELFLLSEPHRRIKVAIIQLLFYSDSLAITCSLLVITVGGVFKTYRHRTRASFRCNRALLQELLQ